MFVLPWTVTVGRHLRHGNRDKSGHFQSRTMKTTQTHSSTGSTVHSTGTNRAGTVGFTGPGLEMVNSSHRGGKRWPVPHLQVSVMMCVREEEKRREEEKSCLIWVDGSSRWVQTDCAGHLVNFPFPRAVSSPPLLVQVPEIDEESQKHEDQVELQSVGEAQRVSQ